jgi:hypothetical protein
MPPRIRIEVEGMVHKIVHQIRQHSDEVGAAVEQAVAEVVNNFDFPAFIHTKAQHMLRGAVESAVNRSIQKAMNNPEVRDLLDNTVTNLLIESLTGESSDEE